LDGGPIGQFEHGGGAFAQMGFGPMVAQPEQLGAFFRGERKER
jgi:hypothetical protein